MSRIFRVAYLDTQQKYFTGAKKHCQNILRSLDGTDFNEISALNQLDTQNTDIVFLSASHIESVDFQQWLDGLAKKFKRNEFIWIPALILAEVSLNISRDILQVTINNNWYYDIISPNELDSLPLRMANLIKIHDHMKELNRYEAELQNFSEKIEGLERVIHTLQSSPK